MTSTPASERARDEHGRCLPGTPGRPRSKWLLPDDGIIDHLAVEIAASGARPVALTLPERRLAAAAILARRGGTPWVICQRLRMNYAAAVALAAELAAGPSTTKEGTAA